LKYLAIYGIKTRRSEPKLNKSDKSDISMCYKKKTFIVFGTLFYLIISPSPVWAYLDPGAGSYFFQIFISFLLAAFFVAKVYWENLKNFIRNKFFRRKNNK